MGSKYTNSQAAVSGSVSPGDFSNSVSTAFGDNTEEAARKRKQQEDDAAAAAAAQQEQQAQGQEPSAWDTLKSMGGDLAAGAKDVASNPGGVWNTMMNAGKPQQKKK